MFKIIKYQLYLLQLENYEFGRYFKLLIKKGLWPKGEQRKELVWTIKARVLFILALGTYLGFLFLAIASTYKTGLSVVSILYFVFCIILIPLHFIFYTLYSLLLWPLDFVLKLMIVSRAKAKIRYLPNLKVIGIAGSYGKTTMKEVLGKVLSARCLVLSTPESVNTPVGIARWILNEVDEQTEIIIVEMGEHYKGDIEYLCKITPPDISVVTGINESHLERMGSVQNVIGTIFEIASGTKTKGMVMLNGDDKHVRENYKKYIWPDHRVEEYKVESVKYKVFDAERLGWEIKLDGIGDVFVANLGEYILGDVDAAVKIAKSLGMSGEEIKSGVAKIKPVEHRLQPIKSAGDILVIDDAYNGNPDGVKEAIKVLSRFENRRKVFITPGLVEMGEAAADVHREIGKQLAGAADVVVLIRNSVTGYIEEGIKERKEKREKRKVEVVWFGSAQEAHRSLPRILKPGDVVVFQNDWGDQYI